jgi:flavin reductase (DIM6/NTAB) family NADH-FMN oxidoreductase RutF
MNAITMKPTATFVPDATDTRPLRDAFGKFATGVTVITCMTDTGPACITANSFSSVSLDPALVLWSLDRASNRYEAFGHAQHFVIHVLAEEQSDLCMSASQNGHAIKEIPHTLNADGAPVLDGALARFECKTHACHDAGDHVIVIGEVQRVEMRDGAPLTFFAGKLGQI